MLDKIFIYIDICIDLFIYIYISKRKKEFVSRVEFVRNFWKININMEFDWRVNFA